MKFDITTEDRTKKIAQAFHEAIHAVWHFRQKINQPVTQSHPIRIALDSDDSCSGKSTFLRHHFDALSDVTTVEGYNYQGSATNHRKILVWQRITQQNHRWEVMSLDQKAENVGQIVNKMCQDDAYFKDREFPGVDFIEHGMDYWRLGDKPIELRLYFKKETREDYGYRSLPESRTLTIEAQEAELLEHPRMQAFLNQISDLSLETIMSPSNA